MSLSPALIFDLIVLGVLILSTVMGYRKGLILTLCGCLTVFVAYFGASRVSDYMSGPLSRALQPGLESNIQRFLDEKLTPAPSGSSSKIADEDEHINATVAEALALLEDNAFYRGFSQRLQEMVTEGLASATASAARTVSEFIANQVAHVVLFYLSFFLILILWAMLSHALDLAFKLPVLSSMNAWCGAGLGLLRGAVVLLILCYLLKDGLLPQDIIQNSYLFRFFCTGLSSLQPA